MSDTNELRLPLSVEAHNYPIADTGDYDGVWQVLDADGRVLFEFPGDEDEPKARRIAACVNACDGIPTEDLERWGSALVDKIAADRIAALEAKVRELEAIDAARTNAVQEAIDNAAIYQDQLTASRQQVERLVEAAKDVVYANNLTEAQQAVRGLNTVLADTGKAGR